MSFPDALINFLLAWMPILAILVVYVLFLMKSRKTSRECLLLTEKLVEQNERMLSSLQNIEKRLEDRSA